MNGSCFSLSLVYEWVGSGNSSRTSVPKIMASYPPPPPWPYRDLEVGDNQSLKIQVARPGIEPRSSCSASQELNHSATAAPIMTKKCKYYIDIHKNECALRKLRKFHVLKALQLRWPSTVYMLPLLLCRRIHSRRDRDTAVQ